VLGAAAAMGSYKLASRIIAEGADLHAKQTWYDTWEGNIENVTALHIASGSWNLAFVQTLLERYGADEFARAVSASDSRGRLPLHWALLNLSDTFRRPSDEETMSTGLKLVNLLLESNPDTINAQSSDGAVFNFLTYGNVIHAGELALMKALLRLNPTISTVNAQDKSGATALLRVLSHHETCNSVREIYTMPLVKLLLAHGADRTACDKKGQTTLHKLAAGTSYDDPISPDLLEMFIPFVDINKADANGWTALHWMARNLRQIEPSRLLVSRGADVNVINKKGNTLLHEAVGGRLIRKQKADETIEYPTPGEKNRALDEIVSILREAGASMDQPNLARLTPAQIQAQTRAKWEKGCE
jgi:ankyrin repeat protein